MYTQGQEFQTGAATTNVTTEQYNYQYQYQMPTTTKTTTTTQQFTTTTPVTYSQQYTTSTPVTYSQQYTTSQPVTTTYSTTENYSAYVQQPQTISTTATTTSTPVYTQDFGGIPLGTTTTTTTSVPTYGAQPFGTVPLKPQPAFKLLRQGSGISPNEQQGIVSSAMTIYQNGMTPISNKTVSLIKKTLGGDWIVIVYQQGRPIDFNMTCVQGNDYMYFTLDNTAYQVCRLR